MDYYEMFRYARSRSKNLGLDVKPIILDRSKTYLHESSETDLNFLYELFHEGLSDLKRAECTSVSRRMQEPVQDLLRTNAYLTIGDVLRSNGTFVYRCPSQYLMDLLTDKEMNRSKLKAHVWLTLSSGEIIDFTFFRGLSFNFKEFRLRKEEIMFTSKINNSEWKYVPMLVGIDFFNKAKMNVE